MLKKILCFFLFLSTSAFAYDCESQPDHIAFKVGQISPKKIKKILKENDYSIEPKLLEITRRQEDLKDALNLGLKIQKLGNEANVYHVDGLVYLIEGSRTGAKAEQRNAYNLMKKAIEAKASSHGTYMNRFQLMHGTRRLAMLRLMKRNEEADQLQAYMNSKSFDASKVHSLGAYLSNTGRFASHKDSVKLCEAIRALPQ